MAAVSYILLWVTGLIILLTSKKEEKYKRWHAIQAIGIGIVFFGIQIVLWVLVAATATAASVAVWSILSLLSTLWWLAEVAVVIIFAVTAYQGKQLRFPIVAAYADKNA